MYSRLTQFDDKINYVVGLKIGFPNKQKVNIISYYQQWKTIGNLCNNKLELGNFKDVMMIIKKLH